MIFRYFNEAALRWTWLGRIDYEDADRLQCQLAEVVGEEGGPDTLLLLEHPPVLTLGRRASAQDILVDDATLARAGVIVSRSDRGGRVTYHGPGQLVGYLIMDLRRRRLAVPTFVRAVEEGLRRFCREEGVVAERLKGRPGLWHGEAKLASVGFHVSRGVSRHGFALNIHNDLKFFEWIIPCGIRAPATSLAAASGRNFELADCARELARQLASVFVTSSVTVSEVFAS